MWICALLSFITGTHSHTHTHMHAHAQVRHTLPVPWNWSDLTLLALKTFRKVSKSPGPRISQAIKYNCSLPGYQLSTESIYIYIYIYIWPDDYDFLKHIVNPFLLLHAFLSFIFCWSLYDGTEILALMYQTSSVL